MKLNLSKNLKKLAKSFKKNNGTLYIVGGYIRNAILGLENTDIDICGNLSSDSVIDICNNELDFNAFVVNKNLGTVLIKIDANEEYEYTTFRKENYKKGGEHSPISVDFIANLNIDAKRRDFTFNAIYYDILKAELIDLYDGLNDLKHRKLQAIETPEFVFSSDGLRLLRMVRLSSEFGFKIEKNTLRVAQTLNYQLKDISSERRLKELKQIVVSDLRYQKLGKANFIKNFNTLQIYPYLFNSNLRKFKIKKNSLYRKFLTLAEKQRFLGFSTLILANHLNFKRFATCQIQFNVNKLFGLDGLKCSNTELENILKGYDVIQNLAFSKSKINFKNIAVKYSHLTLNTKNFVDNFKVKNLEKLHLEIKKCKNNNIPLSISDLKISNTELIELANIKNNLVSKIKNELFFLCLHKKLKNEKTHLIEKAKHLQELLYSSK